MPVAVDFGQRKQEGEEASRQAAHGKHQGQPAGVGMRALMSNPAEDRQRKRCGNDACQEDAKAGSEKLSGVRTHKKKKSTGQG
jgi:hypothetical protein